MRKVKAIAILSEYDRIIFNTFNMCFSLTFTNVPIFLRHVILSTSLAVWPPLLWTAGIVQRESYFFVKTNS